ncbi:MAG: PepSY domain-containing protein [Halieaceae bacterium]|jgi:hypothetical protein|nr:PepSY domain-containing protein [Halieaceae bacterium]
MTLQEIDNMSTLFRLQRPARLLPLALAAVLPACALFEQEEDIPLAEVPPVVMQAAQNAVPGITITEAELEKDDGEMIYELTGEADGQEYEIEIGADGSVLEIEQEEVEEEEEEESAE